MFSSPSKIAGLLALTILILCAARFIIPCGAYGEAAPAPQPPKVPKEMLEKRLEEAKKVWEIYRQLRRVPMLEPMEDSEILGWSERILEAELALLDKQEGRVKALKAHVDRTREVEEFALAKQRFAKGSGFTAHKASYERINAEIRYFQESGKAPQPPVRAVPLQPKVEELPVVPPRDKEKP